MLTPTRKAFLHMLDEYFFTCPYCWEQISMLLDLTEASQTYVEDCEVCCNPISISFEAEDGAVTSFSAIALQD